MDTVGPGAEGLSNSSLASYDTAKVTGVNSDPFVQAQSSASLDNHYSRGRHNEIQDKVSVETTEETDHYGSTLKRYISYKPHSDGSNKGKQIFLMKPNLLSSKVLSSSIPSAFS